MPQPTAGDVHVSAVLTNISIAYMQSSEAFIAGTVFPSIPVQHQFDQYYVWDRDAWFRVDAKKRADGTESAGGGYTLRQDNYAAEVWAFHKDVSDRQRANQDSVIDLDRSATRYVSRQLLLREEVEWAATYFTTGVWGADKVGGVDFTEWDLAGSNPMDDVASAGLDIEELTGFLPNTLVITPRVLQALKNNQEILERIKYTQRGQITLDLIAAMFELERVVVARAIRSTQAETIPSQDAAGNFAASYIFGTDALLMYVNPSPGLEEPSAGYTFRWTGVGGGAGGRSGVAVKSFRQENIESDRVEGQAAWDQKVVSPDLACFFSGAIT